MPRSEQAATASTRPDRWLEGLEGAQYGVEMEAPIRTSIGPLNYAEPRKGSLLHRCGWEQLLEDGEHVRDVHRLDDVRVEPRVA